MRTRHISQSRITSSRRSRTQMSMLIFDQWRNLCLSQKLPALCERRTLQQMATLLHHKKTTPSSFKTLSPILAVKSRFSSVKDWLFSLRREELELEIATSSAEQQLG